MARWKTGVWLLDNSNMVADIRSNFINVRPVLNVPVPNSNALYGIRVNNAVQLPMQLTIRQNDITHCRMGIDVINVLTATGQSVAKIRYNNIGFDFAPAVFNANVCYGIRVINSPETQIDIDTVCYNYRQYATGPLPTNALATQCRGIQVENSNNVEVTNNYCNRLGAGIWMEAICPASRITCNHLVRNYNGVFLNNAVIGNQFGLLANDNRYALTPPTLHSINLDVTGNATTSTNWYYRTNGGQWFVPFFNLVLGTPLVSNASTICSPPLPPSALTREIQWGAIVADTINSIAFEPENSFTARKIAFRHFKTNSQELHLNPPDDSAYLTFQTQAANSNIGVLHQLLDTISTGDAQAAAQINSSINPILAPESARILVNEIYIRSWMVGEPSFTSADSVALLLVAFGDPHELGDAVYSAQVMLDTANDPISNLRISTAETVQLVSQINIFPNPISSNATVIAEVLPEDQCVINVVNTLGQTIGTYQLPEGNEHIISCSQYENGCYFFEFVRNGVPVETKKIMIQNE